MIIRVTVAVPGYKRLAQLAQAHGLSGTTSPAAGAGEWGVESGATAEFAGRGFDFFVKAEAFIVKALYEYDQLCAYVTFGGSRAFLYWRDGRIEEVG